MENRAKVLLVGAAFSADLHLDAYKRCQEIAEVVAICDKDASRIDSLVKKYGLEGIASYDDYEKAISEVDCDLVSVCMPNFLHHDVAMTALKKGRHVIVEKPLATTIEDGKAMLEAAEKAGKKIYYAENWHFTPAINRALNIIEEGGIGKPLYVRARETHSGSHSPFAQKIKYCGGGCMIHLGIHSIGFIMAFKKGRWTELSAMTSGGGDNNILHNKMEGEDWATCSMKFDDGTTALLEANYITTGGMEDVISFYGTKGCMHLDMTFSSPINCFSIPGLNYTVEKAETTTGWSNPAVDEKHNLGYVDEIRHFVECSLKNQEAKPGMRGVDGLEVLEVVNLIYKSAKEGVKLNNERMS